MAPPIFLQGHCKGYWSTEFCNVKCGMKALIPSSQKPFLEWSNRKLSILCLNVFNHWEHTNSWCLLPPYSKMKSALQYFSPAPGLHSWAVQKQDSRLYYFGSTSRVIFCWWWNLKSDLFNGIFSCSACSFEYQTFPHFYHVKHICVSASFLKSTI